jgi:DNA-binding response OmpR family regulator
MCDDDRDLLDSLGTFLKASGYQVETASEHNELMEKLREKVPDLLLLDVRMPEKDGFWVAEGLQALGVRVPIIFMTGYDKWIYRFYAPFVGSVYYLVKPIDLQLLLKKIEEALAKVPRRRHLVPKTQ